MSSNNSGATNSLDIEVQEKNFSTAQTASLNCHIDAKEKVRYLSDAFAQAFNVDPNQTVKNAALADVLGEADYVQTNPHIKRALAGHYSLQFVDRDNGQSIEIFYLPEMNGPNDSQCQGCFMVGFYRDTIIQAELEQSEDHSELSEQNKDHLILELKTKLRSAHNRLLEHEKLATLGSLVPGVSHELNTPIGICTTGISKLQFENKKIQEDFKSGKLTGEQLEAYFADTEKVLGLAETNLRRSADLVQSFKKVGVSQSSTQFSNVDLNELLKDTVAALKPKYDKINKNVSYQIDCPAGQTVYTSAGLLFQVISNLIINSYLHGFDETNSFEISITVSEADTNLQFDYRDTGSGLSEAAKTSIFEPYFTTDTTGQGSGLGMSIVHNIVTDKLKGSIEIHADSSDGFHLSFSIPVK